MEAKEFIKKLESESDVDYGLCPPPIKAEKGLDVLIEHFLGKDWCVTMPISTEQVYTEAIYAILEQNKEPRSIIKMLKCLFQ